MQDSMPVKFLSEIKKEYDGQWIIFHIDENYESVDPLGHVVFSADAEGEELKQAIYDLMDSDKRMLIKC